MSLLRDHFMGTGTSAGCRSLDDTRAAYSKVLEGVIRAQQGDPAPGSANLATVLRSNKPIQEAFYSNWGGRSCPYQMGHKDAGKVRQMLAAGFPGKIPAWKKGYKILNAAVGGVLLYKDGRQVGDVFAGPDAAWKWLEEHAKAAPKPMNKEGPKLVEPSRPHLDGISREGLADHRGGRDISPDDFISTSGFRAEFGLWLPDDERQRVLNLAYDALFDLAEVLDWDPAKLSLEGSLALAFGARGKGNAAATYEPGRRVINMTRLSGAGSLAHEFWHVIDHWAGTVDHEGPPGRPAAARDGNTT
jgi:hypothetical protein